jgi:hypothetical protein
MVAPRPATGLTWQQTVITSPVLSEGETPAAIESAYDIEHHALAYASGYFLNSLAVISILDFTVSNALAYALATLNFTAPQNYEIISNSNFGDAIFRGAAGSQPP